MIGTAGGVAAICMAGAVLAVLLRQYCKEQALLCTVAVCTILAAAVVGSLVPVAEKMEELFAMTGMDAAYLRVLWKALGICYLTGIAGDVCRDSGEQALAGMAELWGRVALVLLALPMLDTLLSLITGVLK